MQKEHIDNLAIKTVLTGAQHMKITPCFSIIHLIVSITKFSIVIGSPRAYLSRNRRAITWVSDYRCPIGTFSNWTPVIGYPRDFHVNYARFNGFLSNVFYSFQNLGKATDVFAQKKFLEDISNSKIC